MGYTDAFSNSARLASARFASRLIVDTDFSNTVPWNGLSSLQFLIHGQYLFSSCNWGLRLKCPAPHDVRYTVAVLHLCEAGRYSVRCWVGMCHWDTETITLWARHSHIWSSIGVKIKFAFYCTEYVFYVVLLAFTDAGSNCILVCSFPILKRKHFMLQCTHAI